MEKRLCGEVIDIDEDSLDEECYMEVGCAACGNPCYPKCKTSCPLFDD